MPHGAGYDVVHGKLSLKRIQPYSAAHAGHSGSSGLSAFGVNVLPHVAQVFWFGLFMTAASAVRVDTSAEALGVRPPGCWQAGFAAGCSQQGRRVRDPRSRWSSLSSQYRPRARERAI